jgi:hypothetical protein
MLERRLHKKKLSVNGELRVGDMWQGYGAFVGYVNVEDGEQRDDPYMLIELEDGSVYAFWDLYLTM